VRLKPTIAKQYIPCLSHIALNMHLLCVGGSEGHQQCLLSAFQW